MPFHVFHVPCSFQFSPFSLYGFWLWWSSPTERHKILPECASLRALLQPTATPHCSEVERCLAATALGLEMLQRVVCVHRSAGRDAACWHIHLGAASMLVEKKCNGAKEAHFWTSSGFLSAMKQCTCVSEHVWMSSVPEKAESVKRNTAWAKREWDGGLALTRLYTFWKHRESGKHHGGYRLKGAAPWLASINILEMALQRKISEAQKMKAESTSNISHIRSHFIWEKMICYKPTSF